MQIIFLNPIQTILLDVIAWLIIQLTIGYCGSKISLDQLNPDQSFSQTFSWEKGGRNLREIFPRARLETPDPEWFSIV